MSAAYHLFWVAPTQEGFTSPTKRPRPAHHSALQPAQSTYTGFAFVGALLRLPCSTVGVAQPAPDRPPLN